MKLTLIALLFSASSAAAFPITVKSCNRDVTFDAAPSAAISNDVNLTEMMLVLGLRDHMVGYTGISGWKTLDPQMRDGVAEHGVAGVGFGHDISCKGSDRLSSRLAAIGPRRARSR